MSGKAKAAKDADTGEFVPPPAAAPADLLRVLLPAEAGPLLDLLEGPVTLSKVGPALRAAGDVFDKAVLALSGAPAAAAAPGPVLAVIPSAALSDDEVAAQCREGIAAAPPAGAGAAINPLLAGLLVAVVQRVADRVKAFLSGRGQ